MKQFLVLMLCGAFLVSCASNPRNAPQNKAAVTTGVKIGKPYQVDGTWYYPSPQADYDETGMASWYGPGFHGKYTASGERYDQKALTAAHTTLPMPSLVRVTDLENGRSVVLRINDRGPFSKKRIIDVSEGAANALQLKRKGTTRVRVQYLREETDQLYASLGLPSPTSRPGAPPSQPKIEMAQNFSKSGGRPQEVMVLPPSTQIQADAAPVETVSRSDIGGTPDAATVFNANDSMKPAVSSRPKVGMSPIYSTTAADPVQASDAISESEPAAAPKLAMAPVTQTPITNSVTPAPLPEPQIKMANAEPAAAPKVAPIGGGQQYFIQVGTFGVEANANRVAQNLSKLATPQVTPVETGDKTLYRVRLGPISSRSAADALLTEVARNGASDARVVNR